MSVVQGVQGVQGKESGARIQEPGGVRLGHSREPPVLTRLGPTYHRAMPSGLETRFKAAPLQSTPMADVS
jgi:hypothetical protein